MAADFERLQLLLLKCRRGRSREVDDAVCVRVDVVHEPHCLAKRRHLLFRAQCLRERVDGGLRRCQEVVEDEDLGPAEPLA